MSISIYIPAIEKIYSRWRAWRRSKSAAERAWCSLYLRQIFWSNIPTYSKECGSTGTRHTARSARVTTKVLYASLPVSELSRLPPPRDNPLCRRHRAPAHPPTPSTSATLSMVFQPYYPTPRDQCSWKGGRAFALAPSAYAVPSLLSYFLLSHTLYHLPPAFSGLSFCFFSTDHSISLYPSHAVALIRAAGAKMPETRFGALGTQHPDPIEQ